MTDLRRRVIRCALLAGVIVVLYVIFVIAPIGQRIDELGSALPDWFSAVAGVAQLRTPMLILSLVAAATVIVGAVVRRRLLAAFTGAAVIGGTAIVNTLLRDVVLSRPDWGSEAGFDGNSFPSGHVAVTVAAVSVVMALRRWPQRNLLLVIAGAVPAIVALSSVLAHAHRVSDVIAGFLLGIAASQWIGGTAVPPMSRSSRRRWTWVAIGATALIAGTLAVVGTSLAAIAPPLLSVGVLAAVASATAFAMLLCPQPSPAESASVVTPGR